MQILESADHSQERQSPEKRGDDSISVASSTRVRIHCKGALNRDGSKLGTASKGPYQNDSESHSRVRDASNESLERIHTFALKSSFQQSSV